MFVHNPGISVTPPGVVPRLEHIRNTTRDLDLKPCFELGAEHWTVSGHVQGSVTLVLYLLLVTLSTFEQGVDGSSVFDAQPRRRSAL